MSPLLEGSGIESYLKSSEIKEWESLEESSEGYKSLYMSLRYGLSDDEDFYSGAGEDKIRKKILVKNSKIRIPEKMDVKRTTKDWSLNMRKRVI